MLLVACDPADLDHPELPVSIRRREKAISDVKMTRICCFSAVTIACLFGCGEAQTSATPPEADSGFLYLQSVTDKNSEFVLKWLNLIVFTLSLKKSKPLGPYHPAHVHF